MKKAARRLVMEVAGWLLLVLGIASLVLPGPGLLGVFAGLALLSQQYDWAERRTEPVKLRALKAAAEGVETWPRIVLSVLGVMALAGCGVLWMLSPSSPKWWPLDDFWWLPGGLATGLTQVASAVIAAVLIAYSYRRFHGNERAMVDLEEAIAEADQAAKSSE